MDVDTPAITIQKEKQFMLEFFPQGCQLFVAAYSGRWLPAWRARAARASVQGSSLHQCRGSKSRNLLRRAVMVSQGGWAGLLELCNAHLLLLLPTADSAPFRGRGRCDGNWKMPLLWCQRIQQISSFRRHGPFWTSEISSFPLEEHT